MYGALQNEDVQYRLAQEPEKKADYTSCFKVVSYEYEVCECVCAHIRGSLNGCSD